MKRRKPDSMEIQQMKAQAKEEKEKREVMREREGSVECRVGSVQRGV